MTESGKYGGSHKPGSHKPGSHKSGSRKFESNKLGSNKPGSNKAGSDNSDKRKLTGAAGELAAAQFLQEKGYTILERNWRCRSGELDIVARQESALVFIEVRTRREASAHSFGSPAESVNHRKIMQVRNTAQVYLHQHGFTEELIIRFDMISVILGGGGRVAAIDHFVSAF